MPKNNNSQKYNNVALRKRKSWKSPIGATILAGLAGFGMGGPLLGGLALFGGGLWTGYKHIKERREQRKIKHQTNIEQQEKTKSK
ncbi:MAG: hypothetical protein AB8B67_02160 [Rickettsiaceae bacterium]